MDLVLVPWRDSKYTYNHMKLLNLHIAGSLVTAKDTANIAPLEQQQDLHAIST